MRFAVSAILSAVLNAVCGFADHLRSAVFAILGAVLCAVCGFGHFRCGFRCGFTAFLIKKKDTALKVFMIFHFQAPSSSLYL